MAVFNGLVFVTDETDVDTIISSTESTLDVRTLDKFTSYLINSDELDRKEIESLLSENCEYLVPTERLAEKLKNQGFWKFFPILAFIDIDVGWFKQGEMSWRGKVEWNSRKDYFRSELDNFMNELESLGIPVKARVVTFYI